MNLRRRIAIITLLASLSVAPVLADTVSGLTTFTSGAQARAAEVNANYQAVKRAVDDNFSRIGGARTDIAALQAAVAALQTSVQALSASNTTLQSQVTTLTTSNSTLQASVASLTASNTALQSQVGTLSARIGNLSAIDPFISLTTVNGARTIRFSGVNLQVVNGLGRTNSVNGTGNVIVGYDEVGGLRQVCSRGKTDDSSTAMIIDVADCSASGGTFASSHKSGSHYLVTGTHNSYSRWGGIVGGFGNYAVFEYASAVGGIDNISSGTASVIAGGREGEAIGEQSTISGGRSNKATGYTASVSGGWQNTANALHSSVSGGKGNVAMGQFSSVSGGRNNQARGEGSHVSGGGQASDGDGDLNNDAVHAYSSILGGIKLTTSVAGQTIPVLP